MDWREEEKEYLEEPKSKDDESFQTHTIKENL
jgi:hypothetical protein